MNGKFEVTRHNAGFKISIGDRRQHYAKDTDEVTLALQHYYGEHRPGASRNCPFCQEERR